MKPEFFCCIGGELKDTIQGIFKCSRIFLYRAAQSQTIDDMLVDGFFNEADDIRVNDLIILYCPEENRAYTFAKVSSIINGVVKTKELDTPNLPANVSAFFNDVGYLTAADLATVAFTGNLSDLNDTTITNPATGEYLRWNGDKWINMAGGGGGSAVWGSVGGDIEDQADLQAALSDKADIDLGNIDSDGEDVIKALAPDGDYDNTVSGLSATTLQTAIDELAGTINPLLNLLYPVGSIYIGTQGTCPLATLIPGSTWQQIQGRYLLASGTLAGTSEYAAADTYIAAGLPNITGRIGRFCVGDAFSDNTLFWYNNDQTYHLRGGGTDGAFHSMGFSIQNVNSIYGQSATIRPTAYAVNVWHRTA